MAGIHPVVTPLEEAGQVKREAGDEDEEEAGGIAPMAGSSNPFINFRAPALSSEERPYGMKPLPNVSQRSCFRAALWPMG